ncbi:nucleotide-binding universal stress UspA family protein [Trueperella bonasi]|uniref:Nucleotide-binding universal stress UspA family protein n=1 Tax=Trueperella bonasi TaxID=312286 RepID=A0ABT9NFM2_9ACTO|nr:universal stress protein [Trueperella bonasi]MDP9806176.1 nucleotide-binding universal stress UspA family protein [Trueperella bonasi]
MAHENIVVVGIDGSEAGGAALEWAHAQARARDARLHVVCGYELPSHYMTPEFQENRERANQLFDSAKQIVDDAVASVSGQGVEVTSALEFGDPTEVLVEISKRVALVVVGGRAQSTNRLADRLLRTVSSAVPANAYCPTVVVPTESPNTHLPIRRVVCGVDGSHHSKMALQRAVWEADRWNATLKIITAVNPAAAAWVPAHAFREEHLQELEVEMRQALADVDEGRQIDTEITAVEGSPAHVLARESDEADLLVLGTRGRGGFAGLLLGSTSQTLLGYSACPTMVVPRRVRLGDDVGPEPVQYVDPDEPGIVAES